MALGSFLQSIPHLKAFELMAEQQMNEIEKSVVAMYFIPVAPEAALMDLAKQFGVMGWRGWLFADTVEKKRALLLKAIELHKHKGTPWAIKEALKAVGYIDADIVKQSGITHDGSILYDGSETYSGGFWATFIIRVHIPQGYTPTAEDTEKVERIVEEYKNERSELVGIEWIEEPI